MILTTLSSKTVAVELLAHGSTVIGWPGTFVGMMPRAQPTTFAFPLYGHDPKSQAGALPAMTTSKRATSEQWDAVASAGGVYPGAWADCVLELRSRVEALEIQNALNAANSQSSPNDRQIRRSASAGSLVEVVVDAITNAAAVPWAAADESACAAILAVAKALRGKHLHGSWAADWLEAQVFINEEV